MPIPAAVVSALISAGSAVASGALQSRAARKANDRSYQQTKELYGMQQSDRDRQNAYGSPAESIARLRAAGLSPASFYGNPSAAGVSAGTVTPGSPEVTTPDIAGSIQSGANAANVALLTGAQKENLESGSERNSAAAVRDLTESAYTNFQRRLGEDLKNTTLAQAKANLSNTIQDTVLKKNQSILSQVDMEYRRMGTRLTASQISLNEKQKTLWDKEMEKMGYDIKESQSRTALNYANVGVANATAREICYSIEHLMPAMVADYCASRDLKTTQAWDTQENARFQQWYNENMLDYLPEEIKAKIDNMNKDTKVMTQQNIRDWIKLPAEFIRDTGIGVGAIAQPITQLFGSGRAPIGFGK